MRALLAIVLILLAVELSRARVAFWGRATEAAERVAWGVSLWCTARYGAAVRESL